MTLAERDRSLIWHPYTHQKNRPDTIPIVRGEGPMLIDETGNQYIDAISSWWVNLHGHAHPYIAEKLAAQARTLEHVIFAGFTHPPAVELAQRLLPLLPGNFSKIFYSDNGSTATEVALKMAIQYWWNRSGRQSPQRNKILALSNSYHGDTFGAMSVSDRGIFTLAFHDKLFEVVFIDPLADTLIPDPGSIACFIYEPLVQGAGSMKIYDAAVLETLLQQCREHEIICIADEVMTGFGRTGKLFASAYCQIKPDIICLSKGLTGGTMAMGVTACTNSIYEAFVDDDKLKTFFHGHSFTANPLSCAAALASLDLLQKDTCASAIGMIADEHRNFLESVKSHFLLGKVTKNHRSLGTIVAFEIEAGHDQYLNTIGPVISEKALAKGVFIRPLGNTVYIMPPYCITREQLHAVYHTIITILQDI